ncbi:PREDICTED: uncharacterized protein LOC106809579 [Priapulus caudatus]|uniref:Uncharacterized protein LOC106809579 n=1 Tax=Priapulus caudatus TaxID=37621 RepID=A0ABM1E7M3_PRICU|nr:PREDICTED: uncharacterized protein LOC106809579 [Priapulus caudatus]
MNLAIAALLLSSLAHAQPWRGDRDGIAQISGGNGGGYNSYNPYPTRQQHQSTYRAPPRGEIRYQPVQRATYRQQPGSYVSVQPAAYRLQGAGYRRAQPQYTAAAQAQAGYQLGPIERARRTISPIVAPTGDVRQPSGFSFNFNSVRDQALRHVPHGAQPPRRVKEQVGNRYRSGFARQFNSDSADRIGSGSGVVIAEFTASRKADQEILKEFLQEASSDGKYNSGLAYDFAKPTRDVSYQPVSIEPAKIHVGKAQPTYAAPSTGSGYQVAPSPVVTRYRVPVSGASYRVQVPQGYAPVATYAGERQQQEQAPVITYTHYGGGGRQQTPVSSYGGQSYQ